MRTVYTIADNIVSPLGFTTHANFESLTLNHTGIQKHENTALSPEPFQASLFSPVQREELLNDFEGNYSLFERALIFSVSEALHHATIDAGSSKTIFIISSTKGNIAMVEKPANDAYSAQNISLHHSARVVTKHFNNPNLPVVISNACISGVLATLIAKRLIESGAYDHAVVTGADLITKFILSGFQSFQAVSPEACKPFDSARQGVTLGEGAATMIISYDKTAGNRPITLMGGATTNDANHISGPSRTGEPLFSAISRGLKQSRISGNEVGFISAHGTATIYNDEMEAKAISLGQMEHVPVNSLKGYYGHTLGAAGLIESIISIESLKQNVVIPTKGYEQLGVSKQINVCSEREKKQMQYVLKTASGFGGCNAAMVFGKQS